jgi:hypothetical protein
LGGRNGQGPKRKHLSLNAPTRLGSARQSGEAASYEARRAGVGRVGPAGPDPRRDFKCKLIFKFHMSLDFGKTLRMSIRRFRRNLNMRVFPKFF